MTVFLRTAHGLLHVNCFELDELLRTQPQRVAVSVVGISTALFRSLASVLSQFGLPFCEHPLFLLRRLDTLVLDGIRRQGAAHGHIDESHRQMVTCVISDTHELESELTIPPCDLLVSCGDWSFFGRDEKSDGPLPPASRSDKVPELETISCYVERRGRHK